MNPFSILKKTFHKFGYNVIPLENDAPINWKDKKRRSFQNPTSCQISDLETIYNHFGPECPKTFIDVGAFDGFTYSNTWALAVNGWEGIMVEPDPESANLCRENLVPYENVQIIEAAVTTEKGPLKLFRGQELGTLSTQMESEYKSKGWSSANMKGETVFVECLTLNDVMRNSGFSQFGVLSVDVEGEEFSVWKSLDISMFRPRIMIWELQEFSDGGSSFIEKWNVVRNDILSSGYSVIYRDKINTVFIDTLAFPNHKCY